MKIISFIYIYIYIYIYIKHNIYNVNIITFFNKLKSKCLPLLPTFFQFHKFPRYKRISKCYCRQALILLDSFFSSVFLKFLVLFFFLFHSRVNCRRRYSKNPEIIETSSHWLRVETSAAKINQSNGCCHHTIADLMSVSRVAYRSFESIDDPLSSATFHVIPGAPFAARFLFSLFHRLRSTIPPPPGSTISISSSVSVGLSRITVAKGKKGLGIDD